MTAFKQFSLPPQLYGDLYGSNLVAFDQKAKPVEPGSTPSTKTWGKYTNGLLILTSVPGEAILSKEDFKYLETILKACALDPEASLLINMEKAEASQCFQKFQKTQPRFVWMLGLGPGDVSLPANFPAFQVQQLGETTYLWTPPLSEMVDKDTKTRLWNALKQLFRIS